MKNPNPNPNREYLKYVEFYITNVCNFNCTNCNRFNNYYFSGQQLWGDYKSEYEEWSRKFNFGAIAILGGEPTLNPSFLEWVDGIASLWPDSAIEIVTNASRINNVKGFYDVLKKYNGRVFLGVSVHNLNDYHGDGGIIHDAVLDFLGNDVTAYAMDDRDEEWERCYKRIKDLSWPISYKISDYNSLPSDIQSKCEDMYNGIIDYPGVDKREYDSEKTTVYEDCNGIRAVVQVADKFKEPSIIDGGGGAFTLHNSNPDEALEQCYSRRCHHFVKGKLYKCPVTAVLPDFVEQFKVDMSDEDYELMHSYKPLTLESSESQQAEFIDNLKNEKVIPQCKFCPSKFISLTTITASTNKERIPKKKP